MTFYIKPPEGSISLNRLYEEAETRLEYLVQINQHWGDPEKIGNILKNNPHIALKSECLIEGSKKDKISHFILRLASLGKSDLQHFFIEAETHLFEHRLNCGGKQAILCCLTALKRHTQHSLRHQRLTSSQERWLQTLHMIAKKIIASGMMTCKDRQNCSHSLTVPWTVVPHLVKCRTVDLNQGKAEIRCWNLLLLLSSVFQGTLEHGMKQLAVYGNDLFEDSRLELVKRSLRRVYSRIQGHGVKFQKQTLTHGDIEHESHLFPLCMQQRHSILLKNNRMRHHERFKYTLFLKDIGLSLNENIQFWEDFYSKPHCTSTSGCTHTWAGNDGKRYVYSIKHLYGLEGGRKNYVSHSCSSLQTFHPQPTEIQGCPFTSTNAEEVSTVIKKYVTSCQYFHKRVLKEVMSGRANAACQLVFALQLSMHKQKTLNNEMSTDLNNSFTDNVPDVPMKFLEDCDHNRRKVLKYDLDANNVGLKNKSCLSALNFVDYDKENRSAHNEYECAGKCVDCSAFSKPGFQKIDQKQNFLACDIEDLVTQLSVYKFTRPAHYYLALKQSRERMQT